MPFFLFPLSFALLAPVRMSMDMMMSTFHAEQDGTCREEQRGFEESVCDQVEHTGYISAHAHGSDQQTKL